MKLKLTNKSRKCLEIEMFKLISEGWKVIKPPCKNWLGKWIVKLEK